MLKHIDNNFMPQEFGAMTDSSENDMCRENGAAISYDDEHNDKNDQQCLVVTHYSIAIFTSSLFVLRIWIQVSIDQTSRRGWVISKYTIDFTTNIYNRRSPNCFTHLVCKIYP